MSDDDSLKPKKVAFYIRVSTEEQAEKFGSDAQRSALDSLVKTKYDSKTGQPSMVFAGDDFVYQDEISGTVKINERPQFRRLIEDYTQAPIGNKPFEIVAVFKIDRFARKLHILMDIVKFFEETGIEFLSATESLDTSTPFGKAMLGIMGVLAELERENILIRTSLGKDAAISKGVYFGPHPPYGYKKDERGMLVKLEKEANVVELIFDKFVMAKLSPQEIADYLKEAQYPSPSISAITHRKSKQKSSRKRTPLSHWRMEKVRGILSDEVYIGNSYYGKTKQKKKLPKSEWIRYPIMHEPIVTSQFFRLAQNRLADLSARRDLKIRKSNHHRYLLSALLKCDHCQRNFGINDSSVSWTGTKKFIRKNNSYSYYYQCNRKNRKKYDPICPVIPIPADELEVYVVEFIKKLLRDPRAVFEYQKNLPSKKLNVEKLKKEVARLIKLRNSIPDMRKRTLEQHKEGYFDHDSLTSQMNELKRKEEENSKMIEQKELELSREKLSGGYEHSLELYSTKYYQVIQGIDKSEETIYELLHMVIDKIVIYAREKTASDRIAGRKKDDQLIPHKIDIYLKLPQLLLQQLVTNKFGVRSDVL